MKKALITLAEAGFAVMLAASPALAQVPLKVLADGPLRPGLIEIGRTSYQDSGQQIDDVFGASPNILARVEAGEAADVLIVQPDHLADLVKSGKVVAGEHTVIGRVGLGLAARADAPARSIATADALRQVLLNADTLLFNTVVSGDQFAAVLERLNIAEVGKMRVVRLTPGPLIYERVVHSTGNDIAAGTIPTIMETTGVRLIGPLPADVQRYQHYAAPPMKLAASPQAAQRFIDFLAGSAAKRALLASGVE